MEQVFDDYTNKHYNKVNNTFKTLDDIRKNSYEIGKIFSDTCQETKVLTWVGQEFTLFLVERDNQCYFSKTSDFLTGILVASTINENTKTKLTQTIANGEIEKAAEYLLRNVYRQQGLNYKINPKLGIQDFADINVATQQAHDFENLYGEQEIFQINRSLEDIRYDHETITYDVSGNIKPQDDPTDSLSEKDFEKDGKKIIVDEETGVSSETTIISVTIGDTTYPIVNLIRDDICQTKIKIYKPTDKEGIIEWSEYQILPTQYRRLLLRQDIVIEMNPEDLEAPSSTICPLTGFVRNSKQQEIMFDLLEVDQDHRLNFM